MKILMTVKKNGWSGETAIIMDLALGLHARGHMVCLATKSGSATESRAKKAGVPVINVSFETGLLKTRRQWNDFRFLGKFIKENGIELIHAHASWDNWISGVTSKMGPVKTPLLRTKHNLKYIRTHLMNKWLYNSLTDHIIAPSMAVKEHLCSSPIVDQSKVHYVPNGIRAHVFQIKDQDPAAVRKSMGILKDEIVIAFSSRLSKRKNPEGLIDAARLLKNFDHPLRFVIAGGGAKDYIDSLKERASGLKNISFLGHCDDVPSLLSAIDIFVLTSHTEPCGLAPLEAMSMGKPVIVSQADGFKDFIKPGVNGMMLEKNTPELLAESIVELANDPKLRESLGKEGVNTVNTDFTADIMVDRTIDLYGRILSSWKTEH